MKSLPSSRLPRGSGRKHELRAQDRDRHADPDGDHDGAPKPGEVIPMEAGREALNQDELLELADRELVIQKGLKTFYEVGEALLAIREKRLYRQSYDTFAEYCQQRWDMSKTHANRLIGASEVVENLTPMGVIPETERQVRPLTQLDRPEAQQAAWRQAVDDAPEGKPTAKQVQAVVNEMKGTPPHVPPVSYGAKAGDRPTDEPVDDYQPEVPEVEAEGERKVEWQGDPAAQVGMELWRAGRSVMTPSGHSGRVVSISGRLMVVDTVNGRQLYDLEKISPLYEDKSSVEDGPPILFATANYKLDNKRTFPQDETVSQPFDNCQTAPYALEPLLEYLGWSMPSTIWEPAAGEGLLVQALYDGGWKEENVVATDILSGQNFFEYAPDGWDIIVTNPPYSLKYKWLERCYQLDKPFALLLPVEVLGAVTAQKLMQKYGFEIMLLDARVDFKMPNKGWDGAGAQFPVLWLCWHVLPEQVMFGSISEDKKAFQP
jgi:hypothetical protein